MFGDNENVVNSSSIPDSKLHKRHNALAYHRTREEIAAGILIFQEDESCRYPEQALGFTFGVGLTASHLILGVQSIGDR